MTQLSIVDIAKAPVIAYNDKNWEALRASITPDFKYDELGTQRKIQGADQVVNAWREWATALPDSKASFDRVTATGNMVVLEVTWRGTQTGSLQTTTGRIAASGRTIELRACQVMEIVDNKVQTMRHYFDMMTMLQQLNALSNV